MVTAPRAMILRAAGINCDRETAAACGKAGFKTEIVHVNRLAERPDALHEAHFFIVPGGFSYGDDLGSGRVLANELRVKLLEPIRRFVRDGKLVLGICNGFQVLVKSGFLPDPFADYPPPVTLTHNDSGRFEDRWVRLKVVSAKCPLWRAGDVIECAVTHGEGKFVAKGGEVVDALAAGGQVVLKYVDASGAEAGFPWNPNGSTANVAGICDPSGRVMGLMPHPEKYQDPTNHPRWTREGLREPDGMKPFVAAYEYCARL
ncbi:MAG: phosphoribosylformylglycinamidine synthase I [Planctomycetes bacterium]|nr:phosphoribosylformylglycinamidine synthase I [Planctomycetota bacterium]